ncbi:MAG: oligopeptide-binding protein oppA [Bdellovibrionales bacterium CG10_big_fil_rev_8_21_14_0_10_45_34]|nr:MAG: oligopeptide-binding protein oppA [Bdellovibrionales bacterium CG10_big_fil_rev_8_21_14_0_10_45_34]
MSFNLRSKSLLCDVAYNMSPLLKIFSIVLQISLAGLLVLSTGCTRSANRDKDSNTFVFRIAAEPPHLDPIRGIDHVSIDLMNNLLEGLMQFDRDMSVIPALATRYEVSKDKTVYTFYLRKDVVWSDGVPFTAEQVFYSWKRMLEPKNAAEFAYFFYDIENAEDYNSGKVTDFSKVGIKVLDPLTVQVTLARPIGFWATMTATPAFFPVREDLIEKHGSSWIQPPHFQTLGPYKLTSWEHDKQLVFEANEKYWEGTPPIKKVIGLIVEEATTAVGLFEDGALDLVRHLPTQDVERIKKDARYHKQSYFRGYYYGFNTTKKPFNNPKVRKAFAHAVDRHAIVSVLKGGQQASASWIPEGMLGYNASIGLSYNPDLAKKYLAEAGYPGGKGFPHAELSFDQRDDNKLVAEALQGMWTKDLGVKLEIVSMEWKVYLDKTRTDPYPIYRMGWGADFPDPNNFMDLFLSNSGTNDTNWSNPNYDKIVREAAGETIYVRRKNLYDQAQRMLLEQDAVIIPLFTESNDYLADPRVRNFYLDKMNNMFIKRFEIAAD